MPAPKIPFGPSSSFCLEVSCYAGRLDFFVVALIAALLGFGGIPATSAGIGQFIFHVFLILFGVSLLTHFLRGTRL